MQEKTLPSYNQYAWRTAIPKMAAALAIGMFAIGAVHGVKAVYSTENYLRFNPNSDTTYQQELTYNKLPHEIEQESTYEIESLAIAGLSGFVAFRSFRKNKQENI